MPLHPKFTYLWHDINRNEFEALRKFVAEKGIFLAGEVTGAGVLKLPLEASLEERIKPVLEKLLVLHRVKDGEILIEEALPFILCLGLDNFLKEKASMPEIDDMVEAAGVLSGFKGLPESSFKDRGTDGKTGKIRSAQDVSCSSGSLPDKQFRGNYAKYCLCLRLHILYEWEDRGNRSGIRVERMPCLQERNLFLAL